jgi:hypothetical protein
MDKKYTIQAVQYNLFAKYRNIFQLLKNDMNMNIEMKKFYFKIFFNKVLIDKTKENKDLFIFHYFCKSM